MPNLFSDLPVAILAWVSASISGLMRMATLAENVTATTAEPGLIEVRAGVTLTASMR